MDGTVCSFYLGPWVIGLATIVYTPTLQLITVLSIKLTEKETFNVTFPVAFFVKTKCREDSRFLMSGRDGSIR